MNMAKRPVEKYDFKALGQAIKDALLAEMSDTGIRIVTATAKKIAEVEKEGE